jgi:hypothetical protein
MTLSVEWHVLHLWITASVLFKVCVTSPAALAAKDVAAPSPLCVA